MMKAGVSTHIHVYRPLNGQLLREIVEAGFETVELYASDPHWPDYAKPQSQQRLADACQQLGLVVNSVHTPFFRNLDAAKAGRWLSISTKDNDIRRESVGRIIDSLGVAEYVPVMAAVVHVGAPREEEDKNTLERMYYSLEQILPVARELGVTLALENITNDFSRGYRIASFIQESGLENLGCCYDCGHATIYGRTLDELREMAPHMVTTHLHDTTEGKDNHLHLFDGDIDWKALAETLAEVNYTGDLMVETKDDTGSLIELQKASDNIRRFRDMVLEANDETSC